MDSRGKIDCFRMPKGQFEGIISAQPKRVDGVIEIVAGLEPNKCAVEYYAAVLNASCRRQILTGFSIMSLGGMLLLAGD